MRSFPQNYFSRVARTELLKNFTAVSRGNEWFSYNINAPCIAIKVASIVYFTG